MLFGNAHVEVAFRETLVHLFQACAFSHGRGDAHDALIFFGQFDQGVGEDFCIGGGIASVFRDGAGGIIKGARTVPLGRIVLRIFPALALFGDDLHNDRAFDTLDILKYVHEQGKIMPVKGTKELEAQFLEDLPALAVHDKVLETHLGAARHFTRLIADHRQLID